MAIATRLCPTPRCPLCWAVQHCQLEAKARSIWRLWDGEGSYPMILRSMSVGHELVWEFTPIIFTESWWFVAWIHGPSRQNAHASAWHRGDPDQDCIDSMENLGWDRHQWALFSARWFSQKKSLMLFQHTLWVFSGMPHALIIKHLRTKHKNLLGAVLPLLTGDRWQTDCGFNHDCNTSCRIPAFKVGDGRMSIIPYVGLVSMIYLQKYIWHVWPEDQHAHFGWWTYGKWHRTIGPWA